MSSGKIILFALLTLALVFGVYHFWFSTTAKYKHELQHSLDSFGAAVESQKLEQVKAELDALLLDDAVPITLKVIFQAPGQRSPEAEEQKFHKTEFIHFLDMTLYSLKDVHFKGTIGRFSMADGVAILDGNGNTGHVEFTAEATARDTGGMLMGSGNFSSQVKCQGKLIFITPKMPKFEGISCEVWVGR